MNHPHPALGGHLRFLGARSPRSTDHVSSRKKLHCFNLHAENFLSRAMTWPITLVVLTLGALVWLLPVSVSAQQESGGLIKATLIAKSSEIDGRKEAFELQIPRDYFVRLVDRKQAQQVNGVDALFLWFLFPTLEGISDKTRRFQLNQIVPNNGVNLSIRVSTTRDGMDMARRRFGVLSKKLEEQPSPIEGIAPHAGVTTLVFIDCNLRATCTAVKTWRRQFVVEYYFHRVAFEKDFPGLDQTINKVLLLFQPKRVDH
jgi:hypothetical protein